MSAYIIVDISVHDPKLYKEYVKVAPGFVEKHQGKYIVRGGNVAVAEGKWHPQRLVVVEFPSTEHAHAFLQDPDYQSVAAMRNAATTSNLIVVEGHQVDSLPGISPYWLPTVFGGKPIRQVPAGYDPLRSLRLELASKSIN